MQQICKELTRLIQCAVLTLAALTSLNAWGLSLGHITLDSTLNQPLRASIELGKVQRLTPQDVRVGLAPKTAFDAMGVDWSSNLSDLEFQAVSSGSGLRIELSTQAPIVEPFLNFVLELAWPNGRLVREYTLLLDPPVLMAPVRPLDIAPVQAGSVRPASRVPEASAQRFDADRMTQPGDTLWGIALAARSDRSTSVQAMMVAIQSRNPDAFMNQNINRLKAGYVLVMPDQEDLDRISFESAVAEVASQNTKQMQPASQKKNTSTEPSVDSELVLVAIDEEAPDNRNADSAEVLAATASAAEKNELINSAAIERDLLAGRLAALETKLESLVGTISLKDQQIVALQKQLKTLESAPKVLPEQGFLTPMSIAFMVTLVILVVVLLLMSARYQRLTRSLRAAPASVVGAELQDSSPALTATTGSRLDSALAGTNPSVETLATASVASAAGDAEPVVTPAETENLSAATPAQVEADVSELDLSALDGLDDLSELETLEDIEALDGLETLEELEDLSELETLDLSDAGDMSETDVASELAVDPDEDPANMLDLARAYVEMGDSDAARSLLNRVAVIGTSSEATEAQKMLLSLSED
ncbi:MAG: FimV/HubP family polar landmark protein [Pseudomonadales bacterium]|nr:FimV/HubP family polar landmark protein [Pseudomonadales bacterium]